MDASVCFRRAVGPCLALLVLLLAGAGQSQIQTRQRLASGDPDGVGGIPYSSGPSSVADISVPGLLTVGLVVDADRVAIPHAAVVVLSEDAVVVAECITDDQGVFMLSLPVTGGMTVTLPFNGVDGIPIEAGQSLLIVVP